MKHKQPKFTNHLIVMILPLVLVSTVDRAFASEVETSLSNSGIFKLPPPPKVFTTRCHNWLLFYCDEISKFEIHSPEAVQYYNKAVELHRTGYLNSANQNYRKAIEIDDQFWEAWTNLGTIYSVQKSPAKAFQCFENSLACRNGEQSLTLEYLANFANNEGHTDKAADYFQRAVAAAEAAQLQSDYSNLLREYISFLKKTDKVKEAQQYQLKLDACI